MVSSFNAEMGMTPEAFAEYICHDLHINPAVNVPLIATSIKTQILEYRKFYSIHDMPIPVDSRIVIKLDIFCGKVHLRDRFEWDLASDNSPEVFGKLLASELGLGGEFPVLVAHRFHIFMQY